MVALSAVAVTQLLAAGHMATYLVSNKTVNLITEWIVIVNGSKQVCNSIASHNCFGGLYDSVERAGLFVSPLMWESCQSVAQKASGITPCVYECTQTVVCCCPPAAGVACHLQPPGSAPVLGSPWSRALLYQSSKELRAGWCGLVRALVLSQLSQAGVNFTLKCNP